MKNSKPIFLLFLVVLFSYFGMCQNKDIYKISGLVYDKATKVCLDACKIKIFATTKFQLETTTDSLGHFCAANIPVEASKLVLKVERRGFYEEQFKIELGSIPHDTIIDIELSQIPSAIDWLPEVYFDFNGLKPDSNFQNTISQVADMILRLSSDPNFSLSIIGYKDSLETKDLRLERAKLVYDALLEKGVDKTRLKIESSNESNILKPNEAYREVRTNKFRSNAITEEFITNSPIAKRDSLRRLNRCVTFRIN
jgi:outer membrane protein OmpA-like peptidoglycan-associated protein